MPEYTNFQYSATTALALRNVEVEDSPEFQTKAVTQVLEYAVNNIQNEDLKQYIIGTNAVAHVANNGYEGAERIKQIVEQHVSEPEIKHAFDVAWKNGDVLREGRPSPDFSFPDANGKQVTLADLRGKYVYIDCWATWCVPCRGELPHLKKLEETFKGMNIAFVSISCDSDKAKWLKFVEEQQLSGIQLWGDADSQFMGKYRIQSIPRFILLGPDGRIINPDMTRPSDPKTAEALGMVARPE
ncbi:MAG: TlpA family protein disulfide reductase [Bacteroidales bacterium]|nr:TlpA family protein disulfide reductase [Candidatus Physcousia equi]